MFCPITSCCYLQSNSAHTLCTSPKAISRHSFGAMALAASTADDAEEELQLSCSLSDLKSCPSARIIKVLLKRMSQSIQSTGSRSENESENQQQQQHDTAHTVIESLKSVIEKQEYSATKLLDDIHHLQYDHGLNDDDTKFDAAYDFFKEYTTGKCDVNECPFMMRHYRVRGRENGGQHDVDDNVLIDIMAQIHCYFVHSFDTNRLTKEERNRVDLEISIGSGLESLEDDEKHSDNVSDDEVDVSQSKRLEKINEILVAKKEKLRFHRDDRRYRDNADDGKSSDNQLDFVTMAETVGVDAKMLKEGLGEYGNDINRLIGDLIDVVYAENATTTPLWSKLDVNETEKQELFTNLVHRYFKNIQLSTTNLLKVSEYIIKRKLLQININVLTDVVTTNGIDGRLFDKTAKDLYQNNGTFSKRFKGVADCKVQHVRQLYGALKKWKYVEPKKVIPLKQDEEAQDGKEDEKEPVDGDDVNHGSDQMGIYEIGKRFYFWDSHRKHPDYVAAKYSNIKEEVLNNPLFFRFINIRSWNTLTAAITALLSTERALRICSNGKDHYMYRIKIYEPLEAQHLRSLKLYTDFTDLSAKFCAILRSADPNLIAGIAHWATKLIETVQCFGSTLKSERIKKTYYRGVDRAFIFKTIATRFNLPLSTTANVKC